MFSRRFWLIVLLASFLFLTYNAATTTVWDDEVEGYLSARQPLPVLMDLLHRNLFEDPPLFYLLMHAWSRIAQNHGFLLRLPFLALWALTVAGLYFAARRMGGHALASCAVAVLALMPYHWLYPVAARWYSLFACLAVWNFLAFLNLIEIRSPLSRQEPPAFRVIYLAGYSVSGALLWYTNYAAPVLFFGHLLIALFSAAPGARLRTILRLAAGWCLITLAFYPWLPVLQKQVLESVQNFDAVNAALSFYVLVAGEFSNFFTYWISIPAFFLGLGVTALLWRRWRVCWPAALLCIVMLNALLATGSIWTKRMMLVTPFLAIGIACAWMSSGAAERRLRRAIGVLLAIVLTGSVVNMFRKQDWSSYRWIDPFPLAVAKARSFDPDVVITDADSAAFYLLDRMDGGVLSIGHNYDIHLQVTPTESGRPRAYWYRAGEAPGVKMLGSVERAGRVAFIHSESAGLLGDARASLETFLGRYGFRLVGEERFLEASAAYLAHHTKLKGRVLEEGDRYRVVVLKYENGTPRRGR